MDRKIENNFLGMRRVDGVILCQASSNEKFQKMHNICQKVEPNVIEVTEVPRMRAVLMSPKAMPDKKEKRIAKARTAVQAAIKKLKTNKLLLNSLHAYSLTGTATPPMIFPTGDIRILFDEGLSRKQWQSLIKKFKGKIVTKYSKLPIVKIKMPMGREYEASDAAEAMMKHKGVIAATPDFHALGEVLQPDECIHPYGPNIPMFQLSFIERAWEFGNGKSGVDIAVLDYNFFDDPDLEYRFDHAYDAADGDNDPRTPFSPSGIDISDPDSYERYAHGTRMSSVIASRRTDFSGYPYGACSAAKIVPIRPSYGSVCDLGGTVQEIVDSWVGSWIDALIQIFYSGVSVANASITHGGLNSELIPFSWYGWLNWLNWYSHNDRGVFFSASSGNCPPGESPITFLARRPTTFAVGLANRDLEEPIGKVGYGLDITVPDGAWKLVGTNQTLFGQGGTSVAAAVVSGTAALIASQGYYRQEPYSSREIAEIVRRTSRRSPRYEATADEDGHSLQFGYGWLDAFAAVKMAHKGRISAGQPMPIHFLNSPSTCVLVPQLGDIQWFGQKPWFWCLVPKTDSDGSYWGHWQPDHDFAIDITAGGKPPGRGLVVADFNDDGLDEIAVQQAGSRQHRFFIIRYKSSIDQWDRMGASQDSDGSALVWGPSTQNFDQVLGADVDGDGKVELVANRNKCIDIAKFDVAANQWGRFGPPMFRPKRFDKRLVDTDGLEILDKEVLWFILNRMHRTDSNQDLLLATAVLRVELGQEWLGGIFEDVERVEIHSVCSLQRFMGNRWEPQPIDAWGTTHIPVPRTHNIITSDIDGDGIEEAVYFVPGVEKNLTVIDFASSLPAPQGQHGYLKIESSWEFPGDPTKLFSGDFDGDGRHELAYLDSNDLNDIVRFIKWDPFQRRWNYWKTLSRKKLGNPAIQLAAGDFDGVGKAEIGLLLEKPFANTYHVYKLVGAHFEWVGEL